MPWGKYRGVRVRHIPDGYLSWLAGLNLDPKFWWLRASIAKEMGARGFRSDVVEDEPPPACDPPERRRRIRLPP